jgi:hypothetical protein
LRPEPASVDKRHIFIQRAAVRLADAFEPLELAAIEVLLVEFARDSLIGRAFLADAAEGRVWTAALALDIEEGALQLNSPIETAGNWSDGPCTTRRLSNGPYRRSRIVGTSSNKGRTTAPWSIRYGGPIRAYRERAPGSCSRRRTPWHRQNGERNSAPYSDTCTLLSHPCLISAYLYYLLSI